MSAQENGAASKTQERPERERGTGRIFQRPKSPFWWIAYVRRGKEIRESTKSTEYRKAEKHLRYRLKELGGRPFAGPAAFEDLPALAVTAERVDAYIQEQLAARQEGHATLPGKAPATVNRGTQLLGQAFRLAVKRGRRACGDYQAAARRTPIHRQRQEPGCFAVRLPHAQRRTRQRVSQDIGERLHGRWRGWPAVP